MPAKVESYLFCGDDRKESIRFRVIMARHGLTMKDIAEELGISPQAVSEVVTRKQNLAKVIEKFEQLDNIKEVV